MMNPLLAASYGLAAVFDLALPVALALLVRRRYNVPWRFLGYGALVFFLSQVITRIPGVLLAQSLLGPLIQSSPLLPLIWLAILAATAGLFEEIGRYLGYIYLIKKEKSWRNALMYGIGHGGLESVLLGSVLASITLVNYIAISSLDATQLPPAQMEQIRQAQETFAKLEWWMPLLGAFERAGAMIIQISLAVMVLQVFLRQSRWWLGGAIAYHSLVDFVAPLTLQHAGPVMAEVSVAGFALISLYWLLRWHAQGGSLHHPKGQDQAAPWPAERRQ
ncbi:MAG: YhfC family intramembrane metalloprotease [Chloroflexi bacterium]|nr:YhfC family intramembrane metalloprotease [Chloroflexota bacterium]